MLDVQIALRKSLSFLNAVAAELLIKVGGRRWLRAALAAVFALALLQLIGWGNPTVLLEMRSLAGTDGEVFYAEIGREHHPDHRVPFTIISDGNWHAYRIRVPARGGLERIRLDPGSSLGAVEVRRIALESIGHTAELSGDRLAEAVETAHSLRSETSGGAHLRLVVNGPDPWIDFRLPPERAVASSRVNYFLRSIFAAMAAALLWLFLAEFAWRWVSSRLVPRLRLPKLLHRIAAGLSDPGVLRVPPRALAAVFVMLTGAGLYVGLKLHQSSIGVWEEMYPAKPVEQMIDLGSPKRIRSDEWNTQAPWVLGQVAKGKVDHNISIGGESAPLLAAVPVVHPSAIAQVKLYGFHLFNEEAGFSWWWAYKTFGLALAFFWLFLLLTNGNVGASALGSLWIYGSSYTQWWLSSHLAELLIAFAVASIGCIYLFFARRKVMVAIGAAMVAYAVLNLLLHMYPPFILPLAYLGVAILAGLLAEPGRIGVVKERLSWRLLCLGVAVVVVGVVGGAYLWDAMPSIEAMASTVYPGRRVATSGDVPLARLLYGYFEAFRIGEGRVPLPPTNASEASSFVLLVPLILLAVPLTEFGRRSQALLVALTLYCFIVALWISVPLPSVAEGMLQAAGWSWSQPKRAVLGLGIGSIIGSVVLFSRVHGGTVVVRPLAVRWVITVVAMLLLLLFGWTLHIMDPLFFRPQTVLLASAVITTIVAGIVLGRTWIFATGVALTVLPALLVNPLVSGLSAIKDKPVLLAAKRQGSAPGDRWAVAGDFVFSQGLKAHGLDVITGSQLVPNRQIARILDPDEQFVEVWNRYAHVVLRSDPGRDAPVYELTVSDQYVIGLNVCGPLLPKLGVNRIAYTTKVPPSDLQCLVALDAPADSGVRLFSLIGNAATSQ